MDALREAIGTSQGAELGQLLVLERLEVTPLHVYHPLSKKGRPALEHQLLSLATLLVASATPNPLAFTASSR